MRTLRALARLFEELAETGPSFLVVHDEGVAKLLEQAVSELERMTAAWDALTTEQRATEEAEAVEWKPSKRHKGGEVAPAKLLPNLSRLLRERGPMRLGGHVYYPAGHWILRFPRPVKAEARGGGRGG